MLEAKTCVAKASGVVVCADAEPPNPQSAPGARRSFMVGALADVCDDEAFHA